MPGISLEDVFSPRESRALPQYGFGPSFTFEDLVQNNRFLFRVYTPRSSAQSISMRLDSDPLFVAPKFDEVYNHSPHVLPEIGSQPLSGTYADVARHMEWTTRSTSPFISTSFSFTWAIWEAARRYRQNVKHDVHIAVIDARAIEDRSVTALELLRKSAAKDRQSQFWNWYQFAQESQDVLVQGYIPKGAVIASIPLLSLLDKLPSYFLEPANSDITKSLSLFDRLAWNSSERKLSYRQFCEDMLKRFLRLSHEQRLRDSTSGSVRLAVEFVRPWFHRMVLEDFTCATSMVNDMSFSIAQWPMQWWAHDHTEMWDLIRAMVLTVSEELRAKHMSESSLEVVRLKGIVSDLERKVQDYESLHGSSQASSTCASSPSPSLCGDDETLPVLDMDFTKMKGVAIATQTSPISPTPIAKSPPPMPAPACAPEPEPFFRPHSMAETASCVVTGLLFGAFITLCVMSSQRRTLLTHLT